MRTLRDHTPIPIENFNGLWLRGDPESVPMDHFSDCENVQFGESFVRTRDGITTFVAIGNVIRMYNYIMQGGQSLLIMVEGGDIYHYIPETETLYGPILSLADMDDFEMEAIAGRAYITPMERIVTDEGDTREIGLEDEFLYVYLGAGASARKAAGAGPTDGSASNLVAYNSSQDGVIDQGIHIIGVTFYNGGGDSAAIGPDILPVIYAPGAKQAYIQNIPTGGLDGRKIWMSRAINPEQYVQGDADGLSGIYELFLAKDIGNDTDVSTIIDIADADLTTAFSSGGAATPSQDGMTAVNTDNEGFCDIGLHVVGVVYETDTGYLTSPGPENMAVQTYVNENRAIFIDNIPTSGDSFVTKRHLVGSKAIMGYDGNDVGYQLFFIPGGTIDDNSTTSLEVSYYDFDLIDDASHLLDNFSEIPAGVALTSYNSRMVLTTPHDDISIAYVSYPGEPEAFNQVDGVLIIPLDGNPITNAQEFRDVLYIFKQVRTFAYNDNGDVPATWTPIPIDLGIGASVHGVCQVLDSGGVNVDFLLIVDYSGIMIFNGAYQRPELSWKITNYWQSLDRSFFGYIQIVNDTVNQKIFCTLPNRKMILGDYSVAFNPKDIKWSKLRYDIATTTITLFQTDRLLIGAQEASI